MTQLPTTISLPERRTVLAKVIKDHRKWMRERCSCPRCVFDLGELRIQASQLDAERMARQFREAMYAEGRMTVSNVVVL